MTTSSQRPQGNVAPIARSPRPIDPGVTIGHVHLRTADIDRVRGFYVDLLGFDVVAEARDVPGWGTTGDILFVSAGGYHHHLGFNTWKSARRPAAARRRRRPAPRAPSAIPRAPAWPMRCGACRASTGRCARSPTTAPTRRSTSATPTATTSSCAGIARSSEWPLDGDGHIQALLRRPRPRRPAAEPARGLVRLAGRAAGGLIGRRARLAPRRTRPMPHHDHRGHEGGDRPFADPQSASMLAA